MASPKAQAEKVPRNSLAALLRRLSHLWLPAQTGASPANSTEAKLHPGGVAIYRRGSQGSFGAQDAEVLYG